MSMGRGPKPEDLFGLARLQQALRHFCARASRDAQEVLALAAEDHETPPAPAQLPLVASFGAAGWESGATAGLGPCILI